MTENQRRLVANAELTTLIGSFGNLTKQTFMSLEQLSYLAQIIGSAGIIISFIFVGLQIRQNTAALRRNEHNSTMREWTVIRMGIAGNRDIAELMTAGLRGESVLDTADQLRLEMFLNEQTWAAFHIWDRTQRAVFPKGTFEFSTGKYLADIFRTPRGAAWWVSAKNTAFPPPFVADVDAVLAAAATPVPPGNPG